MAGRVCVLESSWARRDKYFKFLHLGSAAFIEQILFTFASALCCLRDRLCLSLAERETCPGSIIGRYLLSQFGEEMSWLS